MRSILIIFCLIGIAYGQQYAIIQSGGISGNCNVVDTDSQSLSINGQDLSISRGNTITLPSPNIPTIYTADGDVGTRNITGNEMYWEFQSGNLRSVNYIIPSRNIITNKLNGAIGFMDVNSGHASIGFNNDNDTDPSPYSINSANLTIGIGGFTLYNTPNYTGLPIQFKSRSEQELPSGVERYRGVKLVEWGATGRPVSPINGEMGYNTTDNKMEYWNGSTWVQW